MDGDTTDASDKRWMDGAPDNVDGGEDCCEGQFGGWNDMPCNTAITRRLICQL